jgi:cell division protein FtsN
MDKYLLQILKEVKTIIIPGLGALTLTNGEKGEILFMPYLKFDDGKLAAHIAEREGMSIHDATNLIAKYVREIEATLNKGERYDMYQFGRFLKQSDGQIVFQNWDENVIPKEPEITNLQKQITSEVVATPEEVNQETVCVQKTYEATEIYSEEDQWNDELDLPPVNHRIQRSKKPILEKTKKDRPTNKVGLVVGMSLILLLIGGTLIVALFYNSTEQTLHQVASKVRSKESSNQNQKLEVSAEIQERKQVLQGSEQHLEQVESTISEEPNKEKNSSVSSSSETSGLKKYHIIMGAFRQQTNAENYVASLNQKGASSAIVTQMEGLYLVSYGSYNSREERSYRIADARKISPKAWLMIFP